MQGSTIKDALSPLRAISRKTKKLLLNIKKQTIKKILADPTPPQPITSSKIFRELQQRYEPRPEYGYDLKSLFKRGAERAVELTEEYSKLTSENLNGLEIGAGDGMLANLLTNIGHEVTLYDAEDWRCSQARDLPLILAGETPLLPFPDHTFDFIISFNTFEHLQQPEITFSEILRVLKPGGFTYLSFGPLYAAPWGLHAYRSLRMPYPQFIFSDSLVSDSLAQVGIHDLGRPRSKLQYLNKWKARQFEELCANDFVLFKSIVKSYDLHHLNLIQEFKQCFTGRHLSLEDVTCSAMKIQIIKSWHNIG